MILSFFIVFPLVHNYWTVACILSLMFNIFDISSTKEITSVEFDVISRQVFGWVELNLYENTFWQVGLSTLSQIQDINIATIKWCLQDHSCGWEWKYCNGTSFNLFFIFNTTRAFCHSKNSYGWWKTFVRDYSILCYMIYVFPKKHALT